MVGPLEQLPVRKIDNRVGSLLTAFYLKGPNQTPPATIRLLRQGYRELKCFTSTDPTIYRAKMWCRHNNFGCRAHLEPYVSDPR